MIGGSRVDLTSHITDHDEYVNHVTFHAQALQTLGYLLAADAPDIIQQASNSNIGQ